MRISDFDLQGGRVVHWELDLSDADGMRRKDIVRLDFGSTRSGPVTVVVDWDEYADEFRAYVPEPQDSSYFAWERTCPALEGVPDLLRSAIEFARRFVFMSAP